MRHKPFYANLTVQVLTAIVIGILLGHFRPSIAIEMKPLGDVFIRLIKMVIGPIVFLQWLFLGDLRSALIVGATIPFALFFAVSILVLRGESANLLSVGAIDFGLIVDATVIMVEAIFRRLSHTNKLSNSEQAAISRELVELNGPDLIAP